MNGKRISWLLVLCLLSSGWYSAANAAGPWARLLTFQRVEADPETTYKLAEENGPWMIMASTFSGDGAEQQANDLALELRKRYKLSAYVHRMQFDFGDTYGRGVDRFGGPLKMQYRRGSELNEVAVLIGNYPAVDDPDAQRTLRRLKYARPECLEVEEGGSTNQSLAGWRWNQKQLYELIRSKKKERGPMGHAFVTTNPLVPTDCYSAPGVDELVLKMNRGVKHGLLDCPGKYSVQVACFKGNVIIKQDEIKAVENGKGVKSKLAEAAMKAHQLTEALRVKGWEAYEFHDRQASIVTVGSFDSVGAPRADGRIEINPRIHTIMQTFGANQTNIPGLTSGATAVKSLVGIPFDIQPMPVQIPKRSISREMAGGLFGG